MTLKKIFALVKNNFSAITLNQILRKLFCKNHPGHHQTCFFTKLQKNTLIFMHFLAKITLTEHGKMGQRKNVPLFLGISEDKASLFRSIWAVK